MEFSTQIIATPVSANTAAHILACPTADKINTNSFTPRAKATF